jgi:hypothetical protein
MFTALPVLPIVVLPEPSVNIAATVKADVRKSPPARGFLRRGFLGPSSSAVPVDPQPTPDVSVGVSSSALVVRDACPPSLPWIGLFLVLRMFVLWWGFR